MIKMKFGDFEFPCNPRSVKTEVSKNLKQQVLIENEGAVFHISHNAAVIKCEGSFWGEGREKFADSLKILCRRAEHGWLFLPDGSCYDAYLASVSFDEDARRDCISYSAVFIENESGKKSGYDFGFTYAENGENMFDIAHRCGKSIESLMALNDFATPFSVSQGDRVVLK